MAVGLQEADDEDVVGCRDDTLLGLMMKAHQRYRFVLKSPHLLFLNQKRALPDIVGETVEGTIAGRHRSIPRRIEEWHPFSSISTRVCLRRIVVTELFTARKLDKIMTKLRKFSKD
ncbi:MAG: hypothetical protein AAGA21_25530 [Pseudomonadota bacterium]